MDATGVIGFVVALVAGGWLVGWRTRVRYQTDRLADRVAQTIQDRVARGALVDRSALGEAMTEAVWRSVRRAVPAHVHARSEEYRVGYEHGRAAGAYAVAGDALAAVSLAARAATASTDRATAATVAGAVTPGIYGQVTDAGKVDRRTPAHLLRRVAARCGLVIVAVLGSGLVAAAQPVTPAPFFGAIPRQDCATGEWGWVPPSMAPGVTPCTTAPQLPTTPAVEAPPAGADLMLVGHTYAHPTLGIWRAVSVVVPIAGPQRAYYLLESVEPVSRGGACGHLRFRPVEAPLGDWQRQPPAPVFATCPNVVPVLP